MTILLLKSILISTLISLVATPITFFFLTKMGLVDDPGGKRKRYQNLLHTKPIPRGGGLPTFISIVITLILLFRLDFQLKIIILCAFFNLIIGIFDDIYDLSPYLRLITNFLSASIIVFSGISIKVLTNPFGGGLLVLNQDPKIEFFAKIITILWIVWCTNVVGWSGGLGGQMPGFVAIAAAVIGILSLRFSQDMTQWPIILLAGAVAGSHLGFLPYNFFQEKIMPGYSGKSLAGFLLAIMAIFSGAKLATAILVLGVPMVDGLISVLRRVAQKRLPFTGDGEHLHHLMLKAGLPKKKIVILYWIFSLILGGIVLFLNSKLKVWTFLMLFVFVAILTITLKRGVKKEDY